MTDVAISGLPALTPVPSTAIVPVVSGGTTSKGTVADVVKGGGAVLADGTVALAANLSAGGHKHTSLANGNPASQDACTVAQAEALVAASVSNVADWKQSVRFATTTALPASTLVGSVRTANANGAFPTVDGVTAVVGDRFLDKDHATGSARGIYTVTNLGSGGTPWVVTRAVDCDASSEVTCGLTCLVEEGTVAGGKPYILTTANPITLNTTALTFTALSSAVADGITLSQSGATFSVAANGVGNSQLRQGTACTVIGRSANSTGNVADIAAGADNRFLSRKAGVLAFTQVDVTTDITGVLPLANGGTVAVAQGSNLTDADQTLTVAGGSEYTLPASTATTTRNKTFATTGSPKTGEGITVYHYAQASTVNYLNGGGLGGTLIAVLATEKLILIFRFDGANWLPPVVERLP